MRGWRPWRPTSPDSASARIGVVNAAQALAQQLTALQWPALHVQMAVLPGLDHGSVMLPGLVDALALAQQAR